MAGLDRLYPGGSEVHHSTTHEPYHRSTAARGVRVNYYANTRLFALFDRHEKWNALCPLAQPEPPVELGEMAMATINKGQQTSVSSS